MSPLSEAETDPRPADEEILSSTTNSKSEEEADDAPSAWPQIYHLKHASVSRGARGHSDADISLWRALSYCWAAGDLDPLISLTCPALISFTTGVRGARGAEQEVLPYEYLLAHHDTSIMCIYAPNHFIITKVEIKVMQLRLNKIVADFVVKYWSYIGYLTLHGKNQEHVTKGVWVVYRFWMCGF